MGIVDELLNAGIAFCDADNPNKATHAPVTLHPTPFPLKKFAQATSLQPLFNELIYQCVQQRHLLEDVCRDLISSAKKDEFVDALFGIWERCQFKSPEIFFNISRSDYMLDEHARLEPKLCQVELNTVSVSLAGLSTRVSHWHKARLSFNEQQAMPDNDAIDKIAAGFSEALRVYAATFQVPFESLHIAMVVHPKERNVYDQNSLIEAIDLPGQIHKVHLTDTMPVDPLSGRLLWNDKEIAIVYYRTGYDPSDYVDQACWNLRLTIEQSRAIKCPDIAAHLAGLKKLQQVLCQDEQLCKIIVDAEKRAALQACFTGIYSLDNVEAVSRAKQAPANFVLKPQREGGGHNYYNDQVRDALIHLSADELQSFVLMERIRPHPRITSIIKNNHLFENVSTISELGIYGVVLMAPNVCINYAAGHVLRTKPDTSDEGGVVAGFSALDSVILV